MLLEVLSDGSEAPDDAAEASFLRALATISNRFDNFSCLTRLKMVSPFTPVFEMPVALRKKSFPEAKHEDRG